MHRTVSSFAGWKIECWEQASGDAASQDAQLVWPNPRGQRLRLAVLDGVTPSLRCRTMVGVDGAMYAAAVVRLALQNAERPLDECVLAANRHLYDSTLPRSRDQTQTCVTAADVFPDGRVELVRAGDCDAFARTAAGWTPMGRGSALTARTAAAWDEWQRRNAGVTREARHAAEERFLGRPEAWTSTAVGRFARPNVRRFSLAGVQELVLASDGARLADHSLDDLPGWLDGLRNWERERPGLGLASEKRHDDVTVIRMSRVRLAQVLAAA
jgi:hypothetical protein